VLVVVASRHDGVVGRLAERWAAHGEVALLTCEDLSSAGWCHPVGAAGRSTAVVGGRVVAVEEISGVLTRRPYIVEHELGHIVPVDRAYVAAEMTAFLLSWLSSLACPVLNRPTPSGLSGPNWWPEQWTYAAARFGLPVRPVRRRAALPDSARVAADPSPPTVTVVGERCLGQVDPALAAQARRFARAVGVDLLALRFSGPEPGAVFLGTDLWPDVSAPEVADAVFEYLSGGGE
jgi:hypothetical protein